MWDADGYLRAAEAAARQVADFNAEGQSGRPSVVSLGPVAGIARELQLDRWPREGMAPADVDAFLEAYLARSIRLHHPGSMAHQVAVPDAPAAVADLVHGAINNPMAIFEMGPAAATVELAVVNWMLRRVGWAPQPIDEERAGEHGAGVLTHGGSLANLTALLAARGQAAPRAWQEGVPGDLAVLAPASSHYSVARAVAILGLGSDRIVPLPIDDREVLLPDGVAAALDDLDRDGRRPLAVVANAPSTATGLHDPLRALGEICRDRGAWFHVDAAHGASALASPRLRSLLDGIELADSVTWDAHKMLRTSGLVAAVLFRRAAAFDAAFHQEASYLFYDDPHLGVDLISRTVECTKAGLGLKAYLAVAVPGEAEVAAYVERCYGAARRFHEMVAARPAFTAPFAPESNIVCFRHRGPDGLQIAMRRRLLDAGEFHLSSAEVGGRRYLRMTVMAPATDEATVDRLLDRIEAVAVELA